jgi:DNA-binding LytR/AlgR family response regulator
MAKKKEPLAKKVKHVSKAVVKRKAPVQYVFEDGKLLLSNGSTKYLIWFRDIMFIDIDDGQFNCIRINCKDGKVIVIEGTLEKILEHLPFPDFIMVHRSFVANMLYAKTFVRDKDSGVLYLSEKIKVKVSKGHYNDVDVSMAHGANVLDFKVVEVKEPEE